MQSRTLALKAVRAPTVDLVTERIDVPDAAPLVLDEYGRTPPYDKAAGHLVKVVDDQRAVCSPNALSTETADSA